MMTTAPRDAQGKVCIIKRQDDRPLTDGGRSLSHVGRQEVVRLAVVARLLLQRLHLLLVLANVLLQALGAPHTHMYMYVSNGTATLMSLQFMYILV